MKILVVTNLPAVYRVDLYNSLTNKFKDNIKFCFIREFAIDYKQGISVWDGEDFIKRSFFYFEDSILINGTNFLLDLYKDTPDVIINAGMSYRALPLVLFSKIYKIDYYTWWGGTNLSESNISILKKGYRKIIARFSRGVISYSELALENYESLTTKKIKKKIIGNNTRDSSKYLKKIMSYKVKRNDSNIRFITVGYQTRRKNTIAILKAMCKLDIKKYKYELVVIGNGPELKNIVAFCKKNRLSNVRFLGHVSPEDVMKEYMNADVFIHPSLLDQWPQTYNEASIAGLPILVSKCSGVFDEYTKAFENTAMFDPYDTKKISMLMKTLIKDRSLRLDMGCKAQETALKYDARSVADAIVNI